MSKSLTYIINIFQILFKDSIKIKETAEQKISNMIKKIKESESSLSSECHIQDTKNVNYEENLDSLETVIYLSSILFNFNLFINY